jgi:hypothetical protein
VWHFASQRKSLKQSPFQELESLWATWFKQARDNALISGTLLRAKALQIATTLGICFKLSTTRYWESIKCRLFNNERMEKGTGTKIIEAYEPKHL